MKRIFNTAIIIICVLCVVAVAQKKQPERDPCRDPMSQLEMNFCARSQHEKADAELNIAYKRLLTELAGYENNLRPKVQKAQLLWLKYRDANCDSESSVYEGGSIRPTIYFSCLASLTQERTKRLNAFLEEMR